MKTLLAIFLFCAASMAQVSVECASFPCSVSVTADQCKTFPCALTINYSQKFKLGDKVVVTHAGPNLDVRLTPGAAGALIGTQPNGRTGTVVAGPMTDAGGDKKVRWQIDYVIGVDGWSIQDFLLKAKPAVPPPPPPKSVVLKWDAPAVPAASYNLYRTLPDGSYGKVGNVVGSILTFTDTPVPSGSYSYVARAVDGVGRESPDSNIASVIIP